MTIGNRITSLRKELQLSQEDIAYQIGVTRQSISKWETDSCAPDAYNLIALANVLNTSVEYIVTGKTNETSDTTLSKTKSQNNEQKGLSTLGYIILVCGFFMVLVGMFLDSVWSIIGGFIAVIGIALALAHKKKTLIISFLIIGILAFLTILLLTL